MKNLGLKLPFNCYRQVITAFDIFLAKTVKMVFFNLIKSITYKPYFSKIAIKEAG